MSRVILTPTAQADLDRLIRSHSHPASTPSRLQRSLAPLAQFPEVGARPTGSWARSRFVLGPWRWLIVVYDHDEAADIVWIVTIVDGRSAASPPTTRDR